MLSVVAAAWLVWLERGDLELLAGASAWVVAGMVFMHMVSIATHSERFRLILGLHSRRKLSVARWMRLYVRGRLFSSLVPQSGHVYRAVDLRQNDAIPIQRYIGSAATQKWMAVVANFGFAGVFSWIGLRSTPQPYSAAMPLALLTLMAVVAIVPFLLSRLSDLIPERVRDMWIARTATEVLELVRGTVRSSGVVSAFLIYALVGFIAGAFGLVYAFSIVGEEIAWVAAAALLSFIYLGGLISLTPANWGLQELGLGVLVTLFGFAPAIGVVVSLIVRLSNVVSLAVLTSVLEIEGALTPRRAQSWEEGRL